MLINKGVAGKLVTDMTEMTAFFPPSHVRAYIYYLFVISVIKKKWFLI